MNIRKWVYRKWVHSNWQYMLKVLILQCLNIIKHSIHLTGPRDHDGDHRVCLPVNFAPYPIHIRWLWTHFYRFRIFGVFRIFLKTEHLRSTHNISHTHLLYTHSLMFNSCSIDFAGVQIFVGRSLVHDPISNKFCICCLVGRLAGPNLVERFSF
jgi:hypothetical protein